MDLDQLTSDQRVILDQFREKVKDYKLQFPDDTYLLRWLVARDFDLCKADTMLQNSLDWRRKNRVDTILQEYRPPEVLSKYFPVGRVGQDKLLNPLWIVRYGMTDIRGILRSVTKKDFIIHIMTLVEGCFYEVYAEPEKYQRHPGAMVQGTIIFDLHNFSIQHVTCKPAMEAIIEFLQIYEANYPEVLHKAFVINAPKVFSMAFSMLKPFLHERTPKKISVFDHDSKQWKAAILSIVHPEALPVSYGGTLTDADGNPDCFSLVSMGGEVPPSYYFNGKIDTTNKIALEIPSRRKERVQIKVEKPGATLRWEFQSEDGDLAFAVFFCNGNELIPIIPSLRVDCHLSIEKGEICCDQVGEYIVEFDNSFSYLRSKKIWYYVGVLYSVD